VFILKINFEKKKFLIYFPATTNVPVFKILIMSLGKGNSATHRKFLLAGSKIVREHDVLFWIAMSISLMIRLPITVAVHEDFQVQLTRGNGGSEPAV